MGKASQKRRARKHRRQNKAIIKYGKKAAPKHQLKTGRTGKVFAKQLQSRNILIKEEE